MDPAQTPNERFEMAQDLGKRALAFLIKAQIPPVPPHYAVGYAFFEGVPEEVHKVLQECLQKGEPLSEALLQALYERYILPDGYTRFRSVRIDLERLLKALLASLRAADTDNRCFLDDLEANLQALERAEDAATLQGIAQALIAAAQRAKSDQQRLKQELEQARAELKHAHQELEVHRKAALVDPLTGLYNRRGLEQILHELWPTTPQLTMLVADIDHFKKINDTYGHQVGDVVIRQVAESIRRTIRGEDFAARYGGEEYVILLPDTDLDGGLKVAENIRARVAKLRLVRKHDQLAIDAFTVSLGVATRRPEDRQHDDLFKRADEALYLSKGGGRNRVTSVV
jgi:diguanylate cyclase